MQFIINKFSPTKFILNFPSFGVEVKNEVRWMKKCVKTFHFLCDFVIGIHHPMFKKQIVAKCRAS